MANISDVQLSLAMVYTHTHKHIGKKREKKTLSEQQATGNNITDSHIHMLYL